MDDALRPTADSVQRLVRALVAEPHAAEDVAQEAWLAALQKRIAEPELGRWLTGAARRLSHSLRRDAARRREREARAPRRGATPSALESAARLELVKRVIAAVEALDEPFRTAVVLRYFEDLPPRTMARRLGVPVNTARSRVRRGVEALRGRLEPENLLALLPLSFERAPFPVARALPLSVRVRVGVGVGLVAAGALVVLVQSRSAAREPLAAGARLADASPAAREAGSAALVAPVERRASAPEAQGREPLPGAPAASALGARAEPDIAPVASLAEIRGQFVGADGRALAGVPLALSMDLILASAPKSADPAGGVGALRRAWVAPTATTDAEGRFALRFAPPAGMGFLLELTRESGVRWLWSWFGVAAGEELDLGRVVLDGGASLEGRITDARGIASALAWEVVATAVLQSSPRSELEVGASATYEPALGAYRLAGLPPGTYTLGASSASAGSLQGPTVELGAHEARVADLVFAGPDPARRIVVATDVRGFPGTELAPECLTLTGSDGAARHPEAEPRSRRSWAFEDVAPGAYTLAVDDPRFRPWRREGLQPGARVSVELVGTATLVLRAVDQASGAPLERFAVSLETRGESCPFVYTLHTGESALVDGRLEGVVPGDYGLIASAEGYGLEALELAALAPGETRTLELSFGPGAALAGRARRADGAPAAEALILCLTPAQRDDSAKSPIMPGDVRIGGDWRAFRRELARVRADAEGAFRIELPRPGAYVLATLSDSARPVPLQVVSVAEDQTVELELEIP